MIHFILIWNLMFDQEFSVGDDGKLLSGLRFGLPLNSSLYILYGFALRFFKRIQGPIFRLIPDQCEHFLLQGQSMITIASFYDFIPFLKKFLFFSFFFIFFFSGVEMLDFNFLKNNFYDTL